MARRPNLLLILADDLGSGECGFQGGADVPTPNLDGIARNGVRFTQAYSSCSLCSPARAGLLTGRYQTRFGHEFNPIGLQNNEPEIGLDLREKTLAEVLRGAGYLTGMVGKWHLGGAAKFHPQRRGFGEFYGFLHEGHFFVPPGDLSVQEKLRPNEPAYDRENPMLRGRMPIEEPRYLTDAMGEEAAAFVHRAGEKPWFLYLAFNAPHSPQQAKHSDVEMFQGIRDPKRRIFCAMVAAMDRAVGTVMRALRDRGTEEDTVIVFLSDNGGPTAELSSSNGMLRSGKGRFYEGGIRIPMAMQWKRRWKAGSVFSEPVIALDVFPTMLAAAGVAVPPGLRLDGVDLDAFLRGERRGAPHEELYWRMGNAYALRRGPWKLVHQPEGAKAADELFDLREDAAEGKDLAAVVPERLRAMKERWAAKDAEMVTPAWPPYQAARYAK
jgi:arylsulfatase B